MSQIQSKVFLKIQTIKNNFSSPAIPPWRNLFSTIFFYFYNLQNYQKDTNIFLLDSKFNYALLHIIFCLIFRDIRLHVQYN